MPDDVKSHAIASPSSEDAAFEELAIQALSKLSAHRRFSPADRAEQDISLLCDALLDDDPTTLRPVVTKLLDGDITPETFIQSYAGDAARRIGTMWEENKISFADVTIAVARLQESVRRIQSRNVNFLNMENRPEVLIVVPRDEDHMIGAFICRDAFEELGCTCTLSIGQRVREVSMLAGSHRFDMVGISISSSRTVKTAARLVKEIRTKLRRSTPIVIGGGITQQDRDLCAETGADLATSDPKKAVEFCNIVSRTTASGEQHVS
ncbi:MAG: cobalamin-dependent protein [Pseudomonadota bacterium]